MWDLGVLSVPAIPSISPTDYTTPRWTGLVFDMGRSIIPKASCLGQAIVTATANSDTISWALFSGLAPNPASTASGRYPNPLIIIAKSAAVPLNHFFTESQFTSIAVFLFCSSCIIRFPFQNGSANRNPARQIPESCRIRQCPDR